MINQFNKKEVIDFLNTRGIMNKHILVIAKNIAELRHNSWFDFSDYEEDGQMIITEEDITLSYNRISYGESYSGYLEFPTEYLYNDKYVELEQETLRKKVENAKREKEDENKRAQGLKYEQYLTLRQEFENKED